MRSEPAAGILTPGSSTLGTPASSSLSSDLVDRAERGDPEALEQLDAAGLLLGAEETFAEYAERLRCLRRNIERMEDDLRRERTFTVEGITVQRDWRIPADLFAEAHTDTERLYGFRLDWVPGFFINPRHSLLFGGCAFYFFPDFFALFIIRRAFATRSRWLIYSRRELLAHELCHVARIAYGSRQFEEMFAYQTATSAFRRLAGSIFRGQAEAFCFVGSTLGLLVAQMLQTLVLPWWPVWPFWGLVMGVFLWLVVHLTALRRVWTRALEHAEWLAPGRGRTLLFRCTDGEVEELARRPSPAAARVWFEQVCQAQPRWRVTRARCRAPASSAAPPPAATLGPHQG
jgi:hypothetical protein